MRIDLHNHTNYSDGMFSPKELLDEAIKQNINIFAITDHDSVFGCDELYNLSLNTNVKIIKGMELSTIYDNESIHIVTLFKNNYIPKEIYDFSNDYVLKRKDRAILMMNKINEIYNLKINLDKLLNSSKIITRANMLRNIMEENHLTIDEAKFYISSESKAYIPSTKMSVSEGLDLIKNNNGIAILAHPCLIKKKDNIEKILSLGFDGLEVRYPKHFEKEEYFRGLAKKYNLLISAGSDCHGDLTHSNIGNATLNEFEFEPLARALNFKM